ncbi:MAG: serine/threonine protein kinase [Acidobacteria bacterium]|nr:serine/threonine protein kinase [Acidobacteriota bacterium]MBI3426907.1 serine/threonine protein kinase [Acidobacteriota bacterium]
MTGERWQRIKAIFQSALDRAPGERLAYVAEACAGDGTLQVEVESLLKEQDALPAEPGTTVEGGVNGGLVARLLSRTQDVAGQRIGAYQIIRELGHGGMGAVYLAERADAQFRQRVALKLIRRGLEHGEVLRRFRYERQILAGLQHPNIARLLDGGATEDGTPYFALEYVEGEPLDEYCRVHKLTVPQRLELFRTVCAAVHYAHQNLVIHRDLKPGNILISHDGTPKLLDFGIAKLLNPTQFDLTDAQTQASVRPMTPAYASPEQVRGRAVTTASDVYSLGVLLYELLTGRRPYEIAGLSVREIEQAVCDSEPERPSTALAHAAQSGKRREAILRASVKTAVAHPAPATQATEAFDEASLAGLDPERARRQMRGDLDNIVMMALRKEPERRYASAEQLAEDIRRHLAGLPVLARPNTVSYRATKFIQRHKAGVIAALLVVISLVTGLVSAVRQARIAERRFNEVRQLANVYLFEFHDAIEKLPGATPARQLVVKRALEYLERLSQEVAGDRSLQRELAAAYLKVGDVQGRPGFPNLGDAAGALDSYKKSLALRAPLLAAMPSDVALQREHANNLDRLGDTLRMSGALGPAIEHYQQARALREPLSAVAPQDRTARADLASSLQRLGDATALSGKRPEALALQQQALQLLSALAGEAPNDGRARRDLYIGLIKLGDRQGAIGDKPAMLASYRQALSVAQTAAAADTNDARAQRELAIAHDKLGNGLLANNEAAPALEQYRQALALREKLAAADAQNVEAQRDLATSYGKLGETLEKLNDPNGALTQYRQMLALDEQMLRLRPDYAETKSDLAFDHEKLGLVLTARAEFDAALAQHRQAAKLREELVQADPQNAEIKRDLAGSYAFIGDVAVKLGARNTELRREACTAYQRSRALREALQAQQTPAPDEAAALQQVIAALEKCK